MNKEFSAEELSNSWYALKEMLNVFSHQGTANQSDTDSILHLSQRLRSKPQVTASADKDVE